MQSSPVSVFYSPAYVQAAYEYSTTRKSGWIAESLASDPIMGVELVEPDSLTFDDIAGVHDADYVRAVQTGEPREIAESQGFPWDSALWEMVLASNGGVVAAVRAAMKTGVGGSLSSGLHHARRDYGAGNCTFNGLAIGAREALSAGAETVLIADLDAHCGGGTQSMLSNDERIWHLDVSVVDYDSYDPTPRMTLDVVRSSTNYLATIKRRFDALDANGPTFGLCIHNAGMDPHENCSIGGLKGIDNDILAERERFVFEWCRTRNIPIAFSLAGGYVSPSLSKDDLVELHRLTLLEATVRYEAS